MRFGNPFETTNPTPEADLLRKVRLIARVDVAFAVGSMAIWAYVGAEPATRWGAIALVTALVGALAFGAASLIGWLRLSAEERETDWMALAAGLVSFTLGAIIAAFYGASVLLS